MKYGFLQGRNLTSFTKPTKLEEAIPYFIKHAIQTSDGIKIEPGKLVEAIQTYVNEYSENMIEIQWSDNGEVIYPTIGLDEVADHLMNQGHLMVNRKSYDNRKLADSILKYFKKKEIQEYNSRDFIKDLELNNLD
jgi:hypothetical protein